MKKKRFSGILFSFVMALGLMLAMSLTAFADDTPHTHTVGEETITFKAWTDTPQRSRCGPICRW